ncbi:MAG: CbiX/SirB N-terminal domain-containing protein [Candidatus Omnitrophota bacterium]|nr:CbiX/SirB N-terminal domain-containing protein [Candidatus Omnitrophota bacterium]
MLNRLNKACKFFPCHKGLEDCTFCYCPFYPCLDGKKGSFVYSAKRKEGIWSCASCSWIHKRKVTENIFTLIRNNKIRIEEETFRRHCERPKGAKQSNPNNSEIGIIILGHGSRLKKANVNLEAAVKAVKQKTGLNKVVSAYLQLAQPDLAKGVKKLITQGCRKVIIIPFFLFNGNHVTRDIPYMIKEEKAKYPKVNFSYTKNLGADKRIVDIALDIVEEALGGENNY